MEIHVEKERLRAKKPHSQQDFYTKRDLVHCAIPKGRWRLLLVSEPTGDIGAAIAMMSQVKTAMAERDALRADGLVARFA